MQYYGMDIKYHLKMRSFTKIGNQFFGRKWDQENFQLLGHQLVLQ